ncbi:MAG: DUF924 domain-containing protein [Pseudomonadaceae bacterium]|nr:DUF924 domain-containing protein [Pseudomonadaceae bacterium]
MLGSIAEEDILSFWFGTLTPNGLAEPEYRKAWFNGGPEFDEAIASTFASAIEAGLAGQFEPPESPRHRLAQILVLDQFTRNTRRGDPSSFAGDSRALALAAEGVRLRQDDALSVDERSFFYLPFEHSEDLIDQHTAVALFTLMHDESESATRSATGDYLRYAQRHRSAIIRFGRFPHRNAVLGRASSKEEAKYLADGGGFG